MLFRSFKHFNVSEISLRENGTATPFESLEMDFKKGKYMQGYLSLLHCTGHLLQNEDIGIDPKNEYSTGRTLYGFNLTPDENDGGHFQLLREGKLSLDVKLSEATTESVTMICYLVYDSIMEIDRHGNVYYAGSAE